MANNEMEKINAGAAPKINEIEEQIRFEIEKQFPHLSQAEKEAMISSRLKIVSPKSQIQPIKVDLGQGAGKKIKDELFE